MVDTRLLFLIFVLMLMVQRLLELRISHRHEAAILAQGGREYGADHFGWMKALHTAWFVAMLAEVFLLDRPFIPWLALVALIFVIIGQSLRYAAILTLGPRWTVRIMTLPNEPPITRGIYRYVRHPNYLGVILEIAAVPLLHTAYLTALIFTIANAALLVVRIQAEERALELDNQYQQAFADRPRFIP
jgi:methyltransferase